MDVHEMQLASHTDEGIVLHCEQCGRMVAIGQRGEFDTIVTGDQSFRHVGGVADTAMAVSVGQD